MLLRNRAGDFCKSCQFKIEEKLTCHQSLDNPKSITTFICNCTDCRKITASMFASNFVIPDSEILEVKGEDKLTAYLREKGIDTGNTMTSHFCSVCGTLMYRVSSGFKGFKVMRIGTVDDFKLHETLLKPKVEQFTKDRVAWCTGGEGVKQFEGNYLASL